MLFYEDLFHVILVGHSYAAVVVMSVTNRVPERLSHLVLLDSQTPKHGQSYRDLAPKLFPNGSGKLPNEKTVAYRGRGLWRQWA